MPTISNYHRPATLDEALQLLGREGVETVLIAGGTVLVAGDITAGTEVVDLQAACSDLIEETGDGLRIGAMARLQDLVGHPSMPALLRDLAHREGPNTLRNAATIGGTVVSADPESELLAGLLVHEATAEIARADGVSSIPVADLLADPSTLFGGIVVSITVATGGATASARTGRTPADTSIVAAVGRTAPDGPLLALTGVAATPILIARGEIDALDPPTDFRGSSDYRRHLARVLADRVLSELGGAA